MGQHASSWASTPHLAVGSTSGYVDMFDLSGPKLAAKPTYSIGNLTTAVTGLRVHSEGEGLVAFSKLNNNGLKLVHTKEQCSRTGLRARARSRRCWLPTSRAREACSLLGTSAAKCCCIE